MTGGLTFRQAGADDAEAIARLHCESWRDAYREFLRREYLEREALPNRLAVWRARFAAPRAHQVVLLALDGAQLAGFACVVGEHDPTYGSLVDNLHVAPRRTHAGIGVALMRRAADWLGEHHPRSGVYLWVIEGNQGARRFYERLGGRLVDTGNHDLPDGGAKVACRYAWDGPEAILT